MSNSLNRSKLSYISCTDEERAEMLRAIGVDDVSALFDAIPAQARLSRPLEVPGGLSEQDVNALFSGIARENRSTDDLVCFLGAGAYDHYIPSVVDTIASRSEFYTAYTPYQAEASQGILQTIYEYQSMMVALMGMEVSNASLYDAGTAIGEAAVMATSINDRQRIIVSGAVHPHYRQVLSTYVQGMNVEVIDAGFSQGLTDVATTRAMLDESVAAVVVQYPNFFGGIESLKELAEAAHDAGALLIVCANPIALGLLKSPGECGADIVIGEGQSLGVPIGFGGPYLGLFACKREHMWHMPGRVVGATTDSEGNKVYTLTLQTREQHIRREKATSNICTNQALMALAATVYLSALGKNGLPRVADLCYQKAHYLKKSILEVLGYTSEWDAPFFHEFVIRCKKPVAEINARLLENNILGGLDLGRFYPDLDGCMLICATEKRTKSEIDQFVELLK